MLSFVANFFDAVACGLSDAHADQQNTGPAALSRLIGVEMIRDRGIQYDDPMSVLRQAQQRKMTPGLPHRTPRQRSDHVIFYKDGSLATMLRVEGYHRLITESRLAELTAAVDTLWAPGFRVGYHALQILYSQGSSGVDPKTMVEMAHQYCQVGMEALLDERILAAANHRDEELLMVIYTRPSADLPAEKMMAAHTQQVRRIRRHLTEQGVKQSWLRAQEVYGVFLRHLGINRSGISGAVLERMPIPPEVLADLAGGDAASRDAKIYPWPIHEQLQESVISQGFEENPRSIQLGQKVFASGFFSLPPKQMERFTGLIGMLKKSYPWRISFSLEPEPRSTPMAMNALAAILPLSKYHDGIRQYLPVLRHDMENHSDTNVKLRINFCTWVSVEAMDPDKNRLQNKGNPLDEQYLDLVRHLQSWGADNTGQNDRSELRVFGQGLLSEHTHMLEGLLATCAGLTTDTASPASIYPLKTALGMLPLFSRQTLPRYDERSMTDAAGDTQRLPLPLITHDGKLLPVSIPFENTLILGAGASGKSLLAAQMVVQRLSHVDAENAHKAAQPEHKGSAPATVHALWIDAGNSFKSTALFLARMWGRRDVRYDAMIRKKKDIKITTSDCKTRILEVGPSGVSVWQAPPLIDAKSRFNAGSLSKPGRLLPALAGADGSSPQSSHHAWSINPWAFPMRFFKDVDGAPSLSLLPTHGDVQRFTAKMVLLLDLDMQQVQSEDLLTVESWLSRVYLKVVSDSFKGNTVDHWRAILDIDSRDFVDDGDAFSQQGVLMSVPVLQAWMAQMPVLDDVLRVMSDLSPDLPDHEAIPALLMTRVKAVAGMLPGLIPVSRGAAPDWMGLLWQGSEDGGHVLTGVDVSGALMHGTLEAELASSLIYQTVCEQGLLMQPAPAFWADAGDGVDIAESLARHGGNSGDHVSSWFPVKAVSFGPSASKSAKPTTQARRPDVERMVLIEKAALLCSRPEPMRDHQPSLKSVIDTVEEVSSQHEHVKTCLMSSHLRVLAQTTHQRLWHSWFMTSTIRDGAPEQNVEILQKAGIKSAEELEYMAEHMAQNGLPAHLGGRAAHVLPPQRPRGYVHGTPGSMLVRTRFADLHRVYTACVSRSVGPKEWWVLSPERMDAFAWEHMLGQYTYSESLDILSKIFPQGITKIATQEREALLTQGKVPPDDSDLIRFILDKTIRQKRQMIH